jgi:hypothetical protein
LRHVDNRRHLYGQMAEEDSSPSVAAFMA